MGAGPRITVGERHGRRGLHAARRSDFYGARGSATADLRGDEFANLFSHFSPLDWDGRAAPIRRMILRRARGPADDAARPAGYSRSTTTRLSAGCVVGRLRTGVRFNLLSNRYTTATGRFAGGDVTARIAGVVSQSTVLPGAHCRARAARTVPESLSVDTASRRSSSVGRPESDRKSLVQGDAHTATKPAVENDDVAPRLALEDHAGGNEDPKELTPIARRVAAPVHHPAASFDEPLRARRRRSTQRKG